MPRARTTSGTHGPTDTTPKERQRGDARKADLLEAQLKFSRQAEDIYNDALSRSAKAYQDCFEETRSAQSELNRRAGDALRTYASSVNDASQPTEISTQLEDAYRAYVDAVRRLVDTSQAQSKSFEAEARYVQAMTDAQNQPDSQARMAAAYATYLEAMQSAWDKSSERQEVDDTLRALLDLSKVAQSEYEKHTLDAYRHYVESVNKAAAETDALKRSEEASRTYTQSLQEIWGSAQESFRKAAASTVLDTLQRAWSTG